MASEHVITVTANNFAEEVTASSVPVMLDFWAPWCGPCLRIGPIVDEIAAEFQGRAKIGKVNVDDEGALAQQFRINSIPALIFFKGGQAVGTLIGGQTKQTMVAKLEELLR